MGETIDGGLGEEEAVLDSSDVVEQPEVTYDGGDDTVPQQQDTDGNPAWNSILGVVPSSLHGVIRPELENWDRGVQKRFTELSERYNPYNEFVENNISAQELRVAHNIAQQIDQDPLNFFTRMQEFLVQNGMLEAAEELEEQVQQEQAYDFGEEEVPEYVQQLQEQIRTQQEQLQQFQQGVSSYAEQQIQQQAVQQAEAELDSELADLEGKVGEIDPVIKREIFHRVASLEMQSGQRVPLEQAYQSVMGLINHYNQRPTAGKSAPRVLPTGGGLPAPQPPQPATSESERRAQAAAVIQRMSETN